MAQATNVHKTNHRGWVSKFWFYSRLWFILVVGSLMAIKGYAAIGIFEFTSEEQQQIFVRLTEELRCPKCQNNNLVGSDAGIAEDMRVQIYKMVGEGKGYDEISASNMGVVVWPMGIFGLRCAVTYLDKAAIFVIWRNAPTHKA